MEINEINSSDQENVFLKIQELISSNMDNLSIMEEVVDIKTQMDYYDTKKKLKEEITENELDYNEVLFSDNPDVDTVKKALCKLAESSDVKDFRTIEKFSNITNIEELKNWSVVALQESRMNVRSSLLDENQIFISTGLGGKGKKLRFFVVLASSDKKAFNQAQQKIIASEFNFIAQSNDIEIEDISFVDYFATIMLVIPIDIDFQDIIVQAVDECNSLGEFIQSSFIVTNVKKLEPEEIKDYFERKVKENKS